VVSSFQVYLRDTAQGVAVLLTLWFWATPIFINVNDVPEGLRVILRLNPLSGFVGAYRDLLLSYQVPQWRELAYLTGISVAVFLAGGAIFRQLKRGFADVL
jgi:lipopolysaccharide transport system permease protein